MSIWQHIHLQSYGIGWALTDEQTRQIDNVQWWNPMQSNILYSIGNMILYIYLDKTLHIIHNLTMYYTLHTCILSDYNQSVNSPSALRNRLLKYLIPVIIISCVFNLPKFFEAQAKWEPVNSTAIQSPENATTVSPLTATQIPGNATIIDDDMLEYNPYVRIRWLPTYIGIVKEMTVVYNQIFLLEHTKISLSLNNGCCKMEKWRFFSKQ